MSRLIRSSIAAVLAQGHELAVRDQASEAVLRASRTRNAEATLAEARAGLEAQDGRLAAALALALKQDPAAPG